MRTEPTTKKPGFMKNENYEIIMKSEDHRKNFGFNGDFLRKKDAKSYADKNGGTVKGYIFGRRKRGWVVV